MQVTVYWWLIPLYHSHKISVSVQIMCHQQGLILPNSLCCHAWVQVSCLRSLDRNLSTDFIRVITPSLVCNDNALSIRPTRFVTNGNRGFPVEVHAVIAGVNLRKICETKFPRCRRNYRQGDNLRPFCFVHPTRSDFSCYAFSIFLLLTWTLKYNKF